VYKFKLFCIIACFTFFCSTQANADGISPYLPLKTDPLIELEIERLAAISKMPILTKPYHIVTVVNYLKKIEQSHPQLFYRITSYIKRYKQQSAITHISTTLATSDNKSSTLTNNRGIKMDDLSQSSVLGFHQFNKYVIANLGGTIVNGDKIIPTNTYLSFGYEYLQVDIGYREHWLSTMQESSLALSTNAEPAPSLTISNVTPIMSWNAKYELSLGLLEEMDDIHFDNSTSSGEPGFLTMQLSLQPFDWWTIGGVRTFMFAGGDRSMDLSTIWKAIIDPVSGDNCGRDSDLQDCDKESGNQIAAINSKMDFSIGSFPVSFLMEYGGEDTKDFSYELGNIGQNYGVFLPYINDNISFYAEYSKFHTAWYVHHIYEEGYRNDGTVMGHWWGNNKELNDKSPGNSLLIRLNWDVSPKFHLQTLLRTAVINSTDKEKYSRSKELELSLKQVYKNGFINYSLMVGNDIYGDSFYRATFGYSW